MRHPQGVHARAAEGKRAAGRSGPALEFRDTSQRLGAARARVDLALGAGVAAILIASDLPDAPALSGRAVREGRRRAASGADPRAA